MDIGHREVVLHSRSSRALTLVVVVICCVTEVGLALRGDVPTLLRATAPLALASYGMILLFWLPGVRIGPASVVLDNVVRTVTVRWPAITDVETRWALILVTAEGRFTAWAAPRSSRVGSSRALRSAAIGARVGATARVPDLPSSVAAIAPALVMRQWTEYRDAGLLGEVEGRGVNVQVHCGRVLAILVLVVLCALAATLPW